MLHTEILEILLINYTIKNLRSGNDLFFFEIITIINFISIYENISKKININNLMNFHVTKENYKILFNYVII